MIAALLPTSILICTLHYFLYVSDSLGNNFIYKYQCHLFVDG